MKLHIDFETYSEVDIKQVGTIAYASHPSTDIVCMAYAISNESIQLWTPHDPLPAFMRELNPHVLLEAWNAFFERAIWHFVGRQVYGFPEIYGEQWRCTMARARAFGLPGGLDDAAKVLGTAEKDPRGKKLIDKFSKPNRKTGSRLTDDPELVDFYEYCKQDVKAERLISHLIPELEPPEEFKFWQADQEINWRGIGIDSCSVSTIISLIDQAERAADEELRILTDGAVSTAHEVKNLKNWVNSRCDEYHQIRDLTKDTVYTMLTEPECIIPDDVRRVLEIRQGNSLISIKKVYAMNDRTSIDARAHGLFMYHGARTGRASGSGIQPQNLPNRGLALNQCICGIHTLKSTCPNCFNTNMTPRNWSHEIAESVLNDLKKHRTLEALNYFYGDIMRILPGCLRSLLIAAPGKVLMGADYSAIEAVVLAALAGEEWRLEVFRTHGMIYEESASRITGVPFSEFLDYKKRTGEDHPLRKKIGKVAELASGYQGWVGSWKQFGADEHLTDEEIERSVKSWRDASPKIVEFWRKMEACVRLALQYPNLRQPYRSISWLYDGRKRVLFCLLPSGRKLAYHRPRMEDDQIIFEGWNTNPNQGKIGWVSIATYGGKLTENITQAVARDILAHAIVELESRRYPVVLHVHDEIIVEVNPDACVQTFAKLMGTLPTWARDYPLRVGAPWIGQRYRK